MIAKCTIVEKMKSMERGSCFLELGHFARKEHDTLYIDMIKASIDNAKLQEIHKDDTDVVGDAVKKRLGVNCTILIQEFFDKRRAGTQPQR